MLKWVSESAPLMTDTMACRKLILSYWIYLEDTNKVTNIRGSYEVKTEQDWLCKQGRRIILICMHHLPPSVKMSQF